jgi:trans-aconitate methyltransferase
MPRQPKLYGELADWFHILTAPKDYAREAAFYRRTLIEASDRRPQTVLELGSGGGNNASHMKRSFEMTLTDLSLKMLKQSRAINPDCEHVQGDMRSLRLGKQFDAVFVHDAVAYLTTERDLSRAIKTAFVHCRPGGVALFVPDCVRETFHESTRSGGHDASDGRALRYMDWIWDPDRRDTTYFGDFVMLLRDRRGKVRVEYDRHVAGVFPRRTWLRLFKEAGFSAQVKKPPRGTDPEEYPPEVFIAKKPVR